jgi:uroporphyrinogen decarboxylase
MTETVQQRFLAAVARQEVDRPLVAFWDIAPWLTSLRGVRPIDYYRDPKLMFETQMWLQRTFPDCRLLPGVWADFATVVVASAFGCPLHWYDDDAPYVSPALDNIEAVDSLKPVDPKSAGLMPTVLAYNEELKRLVDAKDAEDNGLLAGTAFVMGPVESTALIRGYTEIFLDIYDRPQKVHQLLRIVTDAAIDLLRAQERIVGKLRLIAMADHFPSQLSAEHVAEFCTPYFQDIRRAFPEAVLLYHNEGNVDHIFDQLPAFGANIFHFGLASRARPDDANEVGRFRDSRREAKRALGGHLCLFGNVHPVDTMLNGTPDEARRETLDSLRVLAPGGGLLLSSGGGMSAGTPMANVEAMVETARAFSLAEARKEGLVT